MDWSPVRGSRVGGGDVGVGSCSEVSCEVGDVVEVVPCRVPLFNFRIFEAREFGESELSESSSTTSGFFCLF